MNELVFDVNMSIAAPILDKPDTAAYSMKYSGGKNEFVVLSDHPDDYGRYTVLAMVTENGLKSIGSTIFDGTRSELYTLMLNGIFSLRLKNGVVLDLRPFVSLGSVTN